MRRGDGGQLHVLEVTLVSILMLGAVTSVTLWQTPSASSAVYDVLETRVRDQLNIWQDTPLPTPDPCTGTTALDALIWEGITGGTARWNQSKARFGPGIETELYVSNGRAPMTLHGSGHVVGAGHSILWWPQQSYVLPVTSANIATGGERMVVDAPALVDGVLAKVDGEAVRTRIEYTSLASRGGLTRWSPTAVLPPTLAESAWEGTSGVSFYGNRNPVLTQPAEIWHTSPADQGLFETTLLLTPLPADGIASGNIPIGTTATINFPVGWSDAAWVLPPGWTDESPTPLPSPPVLRAALRDGTPASSTLRLSALAPSEPTHPFDILEATLSNGSLARTGLVVTYPASVERGLPRVLTPTTPYPLRLGQSALFGVAMGNGGDDVDVTAVSFEIPGGYDLAHNSGRGAPLFAELDDDGPRKPAEGWEIENGRLLTWRADRAGGVPAEVKSLAGGEWYITVKVTDDPAFVTGVEHANSTGPAFTLDLGNGFRAPASSAWGKSPGVTRIRVPPASNAEDLGDGDSGDGYPWRQTPSVPPVTRLFTAQAQTPRAALSNDGSYRVGTLGADAVSVESAMANASLESLTRVVTPGSMAVVRGDFESMMQTLQEKGVQATLSVDLYAPPSMGCRPVRSWSIPSTALPHGAVISTLVWDAGTGVPSVFAATEDGYVHRLDALGRPLWTTSAAGPPSLVAKLEGGEFGQLVLVGTTSGKLQALRPLDGSVEWTVTVGNRGTSTSAGVSAITYDAATDRILVGNMLGDVSAYTRTGSLLQGPTRLGEQVRDIEAVSGSIYVLTSLRLHRLDVLLTPLASFPTSGGGFARGSTEILLENTSRVIRLDPLTLAWRSEELQPADVRVSARGDATGDGIEDLVIAYSDLRFAVYDGATGARSALHSVQNAPHTGPPPYNPLTELRGSAAHRFSGCAPVNDPPTYASSLMCGSLLGGGPLALNARNGRTTLVYENTGRIILEQFDATGGSVVSHERERQDAPTALDVGAFGVESNAVAFGDAGGRLTLYADGPVPVFESVPSTRVGHFTLAIPVPPGAFMGTHLVVARLTWTTAGVADQQASLVEWFDVTNSVTDPTPPRLAYHVALIASSRDAPLGIIS